MALQLKKREEIPEDAVILNEKEARQHQWSMVYKWTPKSDVWPFRYGFIILSASAALSGIVINAHFRRKLRLLSYARFSTYLPIVVLPSVMSSVFHYEFISNNILLFKTPCPTCIELEAAALQCGFGTIYPCVLAPLAGFTFATRYFTYNVPSLIHQPQKAFQLIHKLTRPLMGKLVISFFAQFLVATVLTHFEAKSLYKIQTKLSNMDKNDL